GVGGDGVCRLAVDRAAAGGRTGWRRVPIRAGRGDRAPYELRLVEVEGLDPRGIGRLRHEDEELAHRVERAVERRGELGGDEILVLDVDVVLRVANGL